MSQLSVGTLFTRLKLSRIITNQKDNNNHKDNNAIFERLDRVYCNNE